MRRSKMPSPRVTAVRTYRRGKVKTGPQAEKGADMEKMKENDGKDTAVQVRDYQTELEQIMRSNVSPRVLKDRISDYHENDIASSFEVLTRDERERLYRILDAEQLSDIFEYLDNAEIYFEELNARKKVEVLSCMEVDQAAALLKRLAKPERNMLIDLIDNESKRDIAMLESFDEDEIGSRMSMNFIEIKAGISIREAMRELIDQAAENDNISTLYVTDDQPRKTLVHALADRLV